MVRPRAEDPVTSKNVSLPRSMWREIEAEALRRGTHRSQVVRSTIDPVLQGWCDKSISADLFAPDVMNERTRPVQGFDALRESLTP